MRSITQNPFLNKRYLPIDSLLTPFVEYLHLMESLFIVCRTKNRRGRKLFSLQSSNLS